MVFSIYCQILFSNQRLYAHLKESYEWHIHGTKSYWKHQEKMKKSSRYPIPDIK